MALTKSKLKAIKSPYSGPIEVSDRDGLSAKIEANGRIVFYFRFRWRNSQQRVKVGNYPEYSLDEARSITLEYKECIKNKIDPRVYKKNKNKPVLLGDICEQYLAQHCEGNLSKATTANFKSLMSKYVRKAYNIDVQRHSNKGWLIFFEEVCKKSTPQNAGGVLLKLQAVVKWAIARGEVSSSPLLHLTVGAIGQRYTPRTRMLEWNEIHLLWDYINLETEEVNNSLFNPCIKLLLLTGARNSEIREAKRSEFNIKNELWILPAERAKSKKTIRRALGTETLKILDELDKKYGSEREYLLAEKSSVCPITADEIHKYFDEIRDAIKLPHFVMHDFRRTLVTRLSEREVMPHVTEKMLGHELRGMIAIYNKHDWISEQKKAYDLYGELVIKRMCSLK